MTELGHDTYDCINYTRDVKNALVQIYAEREVDALFKENRTQDCIGSVEILALA